MKCQITNCPSTATQQIAWRSDFMHAPAFWYQCQPCTVTTLRQFNQSHGRVQYATTPLPADAIDA